MATSTPIRDAHGSRPGRRAPKPVSSSRQAWRSRLWRFDDKASPYAYIAPFFLVFGAFGLYPLLYTGWIALHRVEMTGLDQMEWVGWENFSRILQDSEFWTAVSNTFLIGVMSTVPQLMVALGLAHLLNYKLRASTFWRTVILTPYATSVASAALVFALVFRADGGLLNWALDFIGLGDTNWANGHWSSKIAISIIVIWRWTGYNTLIYLAAMQAVPSDLYEAASLDGASRWQQFRNVTIPALRPTILFTIVISTIGSMRCSVNLCCWKAAPSERRAATRTSTRRSASTSTTTAGISGISVRPPQSPGPCSPCCCSLPRSTGSSAASCARPRPDRERYP